MRRQSRQQKSGVYAGSFDPLTVGHMWMIEQGAGLFDRLTVAVGVNPDKKYTFPLEERLQMLRESTTGFTNVSVASFSNRYLIHYAQLVGATHILRGIRTESDYEFERTMRNINGDLDAGICTVFLMPPRGIAEVSSSMVRGLIGPVGWVPSETFKVKRAEILERFLARDRIYRTDHFFDKYEQQARNNLQNSIRTLMTS